MSVCPPVRIVCRNRRQTCTCFNIGKIYCLTTGFLNYALTRIPLTLFSLSGRGATKILDGSLSDTQAYAEVKPDYSSYASWLKHSNTAASRLSEGDSMESLAISTSGGMQRGHKMMHRDSTYSHSPRLNRSNSIR